jgi:hypothetical protein
LRAILCNFILIIAGFLLVYPVITLPAVAQTLTEIKSAVADWKRSGMCPSGAQALNIYDTCTLQGCLTDNSNETYNRCINTYNTCEKEVNEKNGVIAKYNEIVRKCTRPDRPKFQPPKTTPGNDWDGDLKKVERNKNSQNQSADETEKEMEEHLRRAVDQNREKVRAQIANDKKQKSEAAQHSSQEGEGGRFDFEACVARWIARQPICHDGWHEEECKTMAIEPCGGHN